MKIGLTGTGRMGALHAATLNELPTVETFVLADAQVGRARALADRLPAATAVDSVDELFRSGLDGLVVATPTSSHAELVVHAVNAGLPVFCEKPIAADIAGAIDAVEAIRRSGVAVHVGFQRRFDAGHVAVREAVASGRLGWLHTLRSCTLDPAPPPREYIPTSGGLFRDCAIHDIDSIRFVTGRQIVQVMAVGSNKAGEYFSEFGDVDTAAAILTLDDDTLALVSATRYNAAGYDVRLEAFGSTDSIVAGLDERTPQFAVPGGLRTDTTVAYSGFTDRFAAAYVAELSAFVEMVAGRIDSPCSPEEALEAFYIAEACELSRRERRAVKVEELRR